MTLRAQIIITVAVAVAAVGTAAVRNGSAVAHSEPRMTWRQHVDRADAALGAHDLRTAREAVRDAVHDAYANAVRTHQWEPLLHVGDAQQRVEQARGFKAPGKERARVNYLAALFRAREQRSLDGVLHVAAAFANLGDADVVRQALMVARELAGRDPVARERVDIAVTELSVRIASANGGVR